MSIAFVLGGLVVAGVFAFVYIQNKKKKEQGQNNNGQVNTNPSFGITDDNSSSGAGGYTPTENAPAEEHNTAPATATTPIVESSSNRDEEVQQSR
jgi:cytochrome bd-type quinol oxidase subunit 1